MYLLYTDETNIDPANADFFAYGGVIIPSDTAHTLSTSLDQIRRSFGYGANDELKFNTRDRPAHITPELHREVKRAVMAAAAGNNVVFLSSLILHKLATSMEQARRNEINRVCLNFNYELSARQDYGVVMLDSFTEPDLPVFLREKFNRGCVGMPYGTMRLDRILGFHLASIGSSNFTSVVDVVLGAFRYLINAMGKPAQLPVAQALAEQLKPLMLRYSHSGNISERSIFFSPREVRAPTYKQKYDELCDFLATLELQTSNYTAPL